MTATPRPAASLVHLIWLATGLVAISGYALAFCLLEGRVEERANQVARSVDQLRADGRTQAQEPQLSRERERLRAQLAGMSIAGDPARIVARFVRDGERIASRHLVKITAISAPASAPQPGAAPSITADPLQTIPLDVVVEGRYVNLLAAFRELSTTRVLAQVELASLARRNIDAPDATLSAALHVTLERVVQPSSPPAAASGTLDVRPQPR